MRQESREYGLLMGHSPLAEKVVLIDFDGTIFPFGELWSMGPPLVGAKKVIDWLRSHDYKVKIFSSRLSTLWLKSENENLYDHAFYMWERCNKYDIEVDGFSFDKEPAEYYIDDKAIAFTGDWELVLDQIKWKESMRNRNGR